jgi:hypothetical protein
MSVSSPDIKVQYSGNGTTTAFYFSFEIYSVDNMKVILTDASGNDVVQTKDVDYTIVLMPSSVTMTVAPRSGTTLTLVSNIPPLQSSVFVTGSYIYPNVIETGLDYLTRVALQQADAISRCLKTSVVSNTVPTTSSSAGSVGEIAYDSNYLYLCVATNSWKRIALGSF